MYLEFLYQETLLFLALKQRLEHGKKYCKHSLTLDEQQLHEIIRTTINQVVFKELLFEALADGAVETGMPELVPDLSAMFWGGLPELKEYDDSYTRTLVQGIEVRGTELHFMFKDGTSVARWV